jgi:organic hydroperoxide reductase OsmC/OhrA
MAAEVRHKEFRFPVTIDWDEGRRTTARVDGKPPLAIATPPVFRGTDPELWSPEDAFVAAAGSCLAVTIAALAERDGVTLHGLSVTAEGLVGRRPDGRFGFVRIDQTAIVDVDAEDEMAATTLVAKAEEMCLVSVSLDLPVDTHVEIRPRVGVR